MDRNAQLQLFERNLIQLVEANYVNLMNAVLPALEDREALVLVHAMTNYYAQGGRWWDKWGIPDSVLDSLKIVTDEGKDRALALSILALHDSGYPAGKLSADYAKADMRELHMRVGAQHAAELYDWTRTDGSFLFTREEVDAIVHVVAHHDDHYLGSQPTPGQSGFVSLDVYSKELERRRQPQKLHDLHQTFVDCDRIWIMDFVSAYKDYVSRYARQEHGNHDGLSFLQMRIPYFFEQQDPEVAEIGIDVPEEEFAKAAKSGKLQKPYLTTTRKIIAAHFKARKAEMEAGVFDMAAAGDWEHFNPHARQYVVGSTLAAGNEVSYDMHRFG